MTDLSEIDSLLNTGEIWRAKEKLQGRLSGSKYNVALYEKYGQVLLAMGDVLEAGKYLFLSGVRKPEYSEAISLYLERYSKKDVSVFFHTFPKSVQASELSMFPVIVINELERAGFKPKDIKKQIRTSASNQTTISDKLLAGLILIVFMALAIGFVIQGIRGISWALGKTSGC